MDRPRFAAGLLPWLPNALSASRGLLGLALLASPAGPLFGPWWFVGAALTDGLDGRLARRFGWVSGFGAALHICADGLFFLGADLALWRNGLLPGAWLLAIFLLAVPQLICQAVLHLRGSGVGSLGHRVDKALGAWSYILVVAVSLGWSSPLFPAVQVGLEAVANGIDVGTVLRRRERVL